MEEETARNLTAGSGGPRPGHGRGAGQGRGAGRGRGAFHGRVAGGTKKGLERLLWTGWTPGGRIFIGVNF